MRGEIDLVDDQEIAAKQARPPLARDIVAARDVNHKDPPIDKVERKSRGQVVAAGFEKDQFQPGKSCFEIVSGGDVQRTPTMKAALFWEAD
jgi:hypothetical protein